MRGCAPTTVTGCARSLSRVSAAGWLLLGLGVTLGLYSAFLIGLLAAGRRDQARAIAGFVPDCAVLLGRLAREGDLPRRRWLVLVAVAGYLASPIDLVPDFLPVIGYLDDAVVILLTLRWLLRVVGPEPVKEHWPGPRSSLDVLLRVSASPGSSDTVPPEEEAVEDS